jgi:serine/threonine protein kinase
MIVHADNPICPNCGFLLIKDGILHQHYMLMNVIGKDGMSQVYLAINIKLYDRRYAIKRILLDQFQDNTEKKYAYQVNMTNAISKMKDTIVFFFPHSDILPLLHSIWKIRQKWLS